MSHRMKRFEAACMRRIRRRPLSGFVERSAFWLLPAFLVLILFALPNGGFGDLCEVLAVLCGAVLAVFFVILVCRWIFRRLLWTVRNRLILTCLLMGVAPVVLFATLTGVAAYLFAGQFATDVALLNVNSHLERMRDQSTAEAIATGRAVVKGAVAEAPKPLPPSRPAALRAADRLPGSRNAEDARAGTTNAHGAPRTAMSQDLRVNTWVDGQLVKPLPGKDRAFLEQALPVWLQPGFSGVVGADGRLFLCSVSGAEADGHSILSVATAPLNHAQLSELAQGLGSIFIYRVSGPHGNGPESPDNSDPGSVHVSRQTQIPSKEFAEALEGGTLGPPKHFFDRKVYFAAPLHVSEWQTGRTQAEMLGVVSRPTMLYALLFTTSIQSGRFVSEALIVITVIFALLELVALLFALRLGRTMTLSIAEMYGATAEIDRGNLAHRIPVRRQDQLGALATSFNTMAGSLAELLEQQREKERMQSELEIAQEVQNNLFPHTPVHLHRFELHGVCRPARTVSGDYYDFILTGEGRLCFALGDISGKGISAALLMASLHSAVRAYHSRNGAEIAADAVEWSAEIPMPSPGKLLALLNRHLFLSTQPAKYATLFLACYDSRTRQLTYSNGGHLTPFVLRADGRLDRLACGGSVVGLLEGLEYPEATIELNAGDLLIAYSDGLTEPENEFEEFGEERLIALVRQARHEPLPAMTTHIMHALQQWIGTAEQPDDMTVVLARQL